MCSVQECEGYARGACCVVEMTSRAAPAGVCGVPGDAGGGGSINGCGGAADARGVGQSAGAAPAAMSM